MVTHVPSHTRSNNDSSVLRIIPCRDQLINCLNNKFINKEKQHAKIVWQEPGWPYRDRFRCHSGMMLPLLECAPKVKVNLAQKYKSLGILIHYKFRNSECCFVRFFHLLLRFGQQLKILADHLFQNSDKRPRSALQHYCHTIYRVPPKKAFQIEQHSSEKDDYNTTPQCIISRIPSLVCLPTDTRTHWRDRGRDRLREASWIFVNKLVLYKKLIRMRWWSGQDPAKI